MLRSSSRCVWADARCSPPERIHGLLGNRWASLSVSGDRPRVHRHYSRREALLNITIFIRTRNEEQHLAACLTAVFAQACTHPFEVMVLDSSSTDRTVDIARSFPVEVLRIPASAFTYARALNFGVRRARGEIFVALSAHAIPQGPDWLESLVTPLAHDASLAATFSRQVPWPDVSLVEAKRLAQDFPSVPERIRSAEFADRVRAGGEPYAIARFSNVSSAVRTAVLRETPYRELPFSEDRAFAVELLLGGFDVEYASSSVVVHSHAPDFREYREVARRATIARCAVNHVAYETLHLPQGASARGERMKRLALFPLHMLVTALLAVGAALRGIIGRERWAREARFYVASLGTTQGKNEGLAQVVRHPESLALKVADSELLGAAVETVQAATPASAFSSR